MQLIDMHSHILPNIDDGSRSLEISIHMAKKAVKLGYTGIFVTPHYIDFALETNTSLVKNKVQELVQGLIKNNIDLEIYEGHEIYFSEKTEENLSSEKLNSLNKGKYILIEFPMMGKLHNIDDELRKLVLMGYIPIIAHPERYEFVTSDFEILEELILAGALLQINVGSIVGIYGSRAQANVEKIIANRMFHFIGTDAHNEKSIFDVYKKAIKKIKNIAGKDYLEKVLYDNPVKVKNNENI